MLGRLELTVKFSELPQPLPVQGGLKIGVQTAEGIVTAILPAKVWKKFEQAAKTYPHWVAALSGSLERFTDGEIALQHPALPVFEKKARPETETQASEASPARAAPPRSLKGRAGAEAG
ncbi:MAG TPA: fertility inhibition FinO-like protein [Candidatus Contendobacter sp.]|nr:fertility inhibition FinO-like protein [Candidatus Contendobacter sp.]HSA47989.1 fertility inhibition FinO-like protein [Candidatus Competibacteraceae bacterium]